LITSVYKGRLESYEHVLLELSAGKLFRKGAGLLEVLELKEKELGITPDAKLAELMAGTLSSDPSVRVSLTLQLLSLVNCADTVVGDGMNRGVSGGERKRVTSGEIMVGPSKVLFMDEISTGAIH
jgi:Fe-S cluster assembly ATPase SufC